MNVDQVRNLGISAHIDSGKTTLSERILYYAGRIHRIQEVRGDGGGATMDHMELERERGITITSAATSVEWQGHAINLIDTPGHVDFTVEVERSLRVLDGAVLVLCAVGGVQAQSLTVDRQMKRYHVPRVAFINKMDRTGADPERVIRQVREKLSCDAILMQLPIGAEEQFEGVVDLVSMQALYFDGAHGETVRREAVPADLIPQATDARQHMLEALSMYSDQLMELLLAEEEVPEALVHQVLRDAVQSLDCTPVFLGSAFRNKGVQPLLDAVIRYLPSPIDRAKTAMTLDDPPETIRLEVDPQATFVGMAFKLVDDPYGQLTFMRLYQGSIQKGQQYYNQRTGAKQRFSRILRMHADKREEVDGAAAGDIVAVMGVDAASGDTYAGRQNYCTLESIHVPLPVIKMAIQTSSSEAGDKLGKALGRFRKEDPTFSASTDEETGETLIAGMGELHLEIYLERIRREYGVQVAVGAPKVSYREAPTQRVDFDYRHKKQTGGSGQFAHIVGYLEPLPDDEEENYIFEETIVGGRIPKQYIPSVNKGFRAAMVKGPIAEFPVVNIKAGLTDGSYHEVDSSDLAFQLCAQNCFRQTFLKTRPVLLEPVMKMEVEVPTVYQGPVAGELTSRRGIILGTEMQGETALIEAEVPLAETFGYSTDLRSMTQGQGTFSMEFARYRRVPADVQEAIKAEKKAEKEARQLVGAR
ncbi:MAG: elongation factor G [Planctomycetales bacterium]|nr:elongation factor G [Planctomycetales bacterium]NIM10029.1 elongation factor G [Planctomycetales bacterium]NIN09470.1 elongation factor G [Planctomycetales bacterium]NIN78578.1 elongation factor G [Planctomycetales bacterium]NIO35770.1 elongation factor G [Planctomycetales bacterium]